MADVRGAWLYHREFIAHWERGNFIGIPLVDTEWQSGNLAFDIPGLDRDLYVVFNIGQGVVDHHSTGCVGQDRTVDLQIAEVPLQIDVQGSSSEGEAGRKSDVVDLARRIAAHFDDAPLDFTPDKLVCNNKLADYGFREIAKHQEEGQTIVKVTHHWVLEYRWLIEATLNRLVQQF